MADTREYFRSIAAELTQRREQMDGTIAGKEEEKRQLEAQLSSLSAELSDMLAGREALMSLENYALERAGGKAYETPSALPQSDTEALSSEPQETAEVAPPISNGRKTTKSGRRPPRPRVKPGELDKGEQPQDHAHPGESKDKAVRSEPVMLNSDSQVRSLLLRLINLESPQSLERLLEATYGEDWGSKKISVGRKSGDGAAKQLVITLAEDIVDIRTSVLARRIRSELDKIAKVSGDTEGRYIAGKTLQNEVEQLSSYMDQILAWLSQYGAFPD